MSSNQKTNGKIAFVCHQGNQISNQFVASDVKHMELSECLSRDSHMCFIISLGGMSFVFMTFIGFIMEFSWSRRGVVYSEVQAGLCIWYKR